MAVTNNGLNLVGDALVQANAITGATIPAKTTFTDFLYIRSLTLLILKSVYENATESTGFDAMVTDAQTSINAFVTEDFIATRTVTSFAEMATIVQLEVGGTAGTPEFSTAATQVSCKCTLYVKTAA